MRASVSWCKLDRRHIFFSQAIHRAVQKQLKYFFSILLLHEVTLPENNFFFFFFCESYGDGGKLIGEAEVVKTISIDKF